MVLEIVALVEVVQVVVLEKVRRVQVSSVDAEVVLELSGGGPAGGVALDVAGVDGAVAWCCDLVAALLFLCSSVDDVIAFFTVVSVTDVDWSSFTFTVVGGCIFLQAFLEVPSEVLAMRRQAVLRLRLDPILQVNQVDPPVAFGSRPSRFKPSWAGTGSL